MDELVDILLKSFCFLLVPSFANIAPVIFKKVNFLNYPVDFGLSIGKIRILGKGKTWRGIFFGVMTGSLAGIVFRYPIVQNLSLQYLNFLEYLFFVASLSFFTLSGDIVKSLVKRRVGIKSGDSFLFFDQSDWILGAVLCFIIFFGFSLFLLWSIFVGICGHFIVKYIGFKAKLDNKAI
jgi:CDP-2,3-bis-(O-geranylgeranyl)-sn-glycerol synthase